MKHQQDALNTANANLRLEAEHLLNNDLDTLEQLKHSTTPSLAKQL